MPEMDWSAIAEQLQGENERLRELLTAAKLHPAKIWQSISREDVQHVLTSKLFWSGVAVGIIFAVAYGLVPFIALERRR